VSRIFKKHDWASAVDILEPFVGSVPQDNEFSVDSRYLVGLSLFNLKQFGKALVVFGDMLKLYPNQPVAVQNAQLGLAKTKYEQGATKDAMGMFKEIVFRFPKTDAALESNIWMGQHAMSTNLYDLAVEYYSQALADFPTHEKNYLVHFELGRAYQSWERWIRPWSITARWMNGRTRTLRPRPSSRSPISFRRSWIRPRRSKLTRTSSRPARNS